MSRHSTVSGTRGRAVALAALFFVVTSLPVAATPCADGDGPEAAVRKYLEAMQNHQFSTAYDYVSESMTDGKSRDDWSGLQRLFYQGGQVNIFGIDVRDAHATSDDAGCASAAIVPNVLKSRDMFNNQGTTEFELYTVVRGEDGWRVDTQETLFDQPDVSKWFPGEEIPEFRDTY